MQLSDVLTKRHFRRSRASGDLQPPSDEPTSHEPTSHQLRQALAKALAIGSSKPQISG